MSEIGRVLVFAVNILGGFEVFVLLADKVFANRISRIRFLWVTSSALFWTIFVLNLMAPGLFVFSLPWMSWSILLLSAFGFSYLACILGGTFTVLDAISDRSIAFDAWDWVAGICLIGQLLFILIFIPVELVSIWL